MAKIMLIDDDVELTDMLAGVLKKAGHQVDSLNTIQDAINLLLASVPDLIILDVMFPEDPSAGMSLAIDIRRQARLKKVPILMLTSVNQHVPLSFSERDIDPEWLPVQQFLEKPVDPTRLLQVVKKCLGP